MLRPSVALTVGSKLYDQHAVALRLRRSRLPALDRLEVSFAAAVSFDAAPGDDCSLEIDGGDGAATVFTGSLTEVRRTLTGLALTAHNGGLALARYRPATSFEKLTVGKIIDNLCGDVSVAVSSRPDGPTLALYAADGRATAAEEIARLALDAGALGAFDGQGNLHVTEEGGRGGEMALRYGRELIEVATGEVLDNLPSITVVGEGAGSPTSSEGRWVIADFLAGSGPTPGPSDRLVAVPELRTTNDTATAAAALTQQRSAALAPLKLRLWLNPKIEPGMRLELADMPDGLPVGECRVIQLVSTYSPGGPMITEVWATARTAGASDLLGSLAGAIGGLL